MVNTEHVPESQKRAFLYLRASSRKQEKSIGDQRHACLAFAADNGFSIVHEFTDYGISAFKFGRDGRPGFDEMLSRLEREPREADYVLIWACDRFSRNADDGLAEFYDLRRRGIHIVDTDSGITGEGISGAIMHTLRQYAAEEYVRSLRRNVSRGIAISRKEGFCHGTPPFGYKADRGNRRRGTEWIENPEESAQIIELYQRYDGGESTTMICRDWNQRGLTTRKGKPFRSSTLSTILAGPAYGGFRGGRDGRELVEAKIEIFLDPDLWRRVNDRMRHPRNHRKPRCHPLSGLIVCGACGTTCHVNFFVRKGVRSPERYICRARDDGACDSRAFVYLTPLYDAIIGKWREMMNENEVSVIARLIVERDYSDARARSKTIAPLRRDLDSLDEKEERMIELQLEGAGTELVSKKIREIQERREHIKRLMIDIGADVEPMPVDVAVKAVERALSDVTDIRALAPYIDELVLVESHKIAIKGFGFEGVIPVGMPERKQS